MAIDDLEAVRARLIESDFLCDKSCELRESTGDEQGVNVVLARSGDQSLRTRSKFQAVADDLFQDGRREASQQPTRWRRLSA